ncbi:MAG TPA: hypothetical protein VIN59_06070 [Alphaproteobacteria bacterium]
MRSLAALGMTLWVVGCASQNSTADFYFKKNDLAQPKLAAFPHCRSGGCTKVDKVSLTQRDIASIKKLFPAESPVAERKQIAKAIGEWENIVGHKTGTYRDTGNSYSGDMFQQDCVDESTNTTVYLTMMQDMGWLKFHTVNAPQSRAPLFSGNFGPHRTAQIEDKNTHIRYAVDSWFFDNGKPAEIIDIATWKSGWHPWD